MKWVKTGCAGEAAGVGADGGGDFVVRLAASTEQRAVDVVEVHHAEHLAGGQGASAVAATPRWVWVS